MNAEPSVNAALTFWSEELAPEYMTSLAGFEPDRLAAKGTYPRNSTRMRTTTRWELTSQLDPRDDVEAHVTALLHRARAQMAGQLRLARASDACSLGIYIHTHAALDSSPGFFLDSDQVALLAELGASMDFEAFITDPANIPRLF